MKVDRCYILLGSFNVSLNQGGSNFFNIDLREIMNGLYEKYSRFSIKLEAYHALVGNSGLTTGDEVQFLHIQGFNWLNGYDTNPLYQSSRVCGVLFFEHLTNTFSEYNRSIIYPSNIATIMFSRPAASRIRLELFSTSPASDVKNATLFGNEAPTYLFSITGVEDTYPIYRQPEIIEKSSQLVLNAKDAVNLEAFRRAIRWSVDLSQVIDRNVYNKYQKFALITKLVQDNDTFVGASGRGGYTVMLSGLNWFSPSLKLNSSYTGNRAFLNLYHQGSVTAISLLENYNGDTTKETFIENIFFKPASPIVELTLTLNRPRTLEVLAGSSQAILPWFYIFNIVPVD